MLNVYSKQEIKFNPEPVGLLVYSGDTIYKVTEVIEDEVFKCSKYYYESEEVPCMLTRNEHGFIGINPEYAKKYLSEMGYQLSEKNYIIIHNPLTKKHIICVKEVLV